MGQPMHWNGSCVCVAEIVEIRLAIGTCDAPTRQQKSQLANYAYNREIPGMTLSVSS